MLLLIATLLTIFRTSDALNMHVWKQECVQEEVKNAGDLVTGNFVVVDSGLFWSSDHPGMDLEVTSPTGVKVLTLKGTSGDKFSFKAHTPGLYNFCFHNTGPNPEGVNFHIHVGHIPNDHDLAKDEHVDPVNVRIAQLRESLHAVSMDQQYMRARLDRHHQTQRSTQRRLFYYTIAEYVLIIATSIAQLLLIVHKFNRRGSHSKV